MKTIALLILPILLAINAIGQSTIKLGENIYLLAHSEKSKEGSLREFVPPSEDLTNWTTLVGVRLFLNLDSPKKYIAGMASEYRKRFPHMKFAVFEKKETEEWVIDYIIYEDNKSEGCVEWNYFQAGKNPSGKGIVVNQFVARRRQTGTCEGIFKSWDLGSYRESMLPVLMKSRFLIVEDPSR